MTKLEQLPLDLHWMARAIALAEHGHGRTGANPIVGAVIVRGGALLGEGHHERDGGPHAEVNALTAARLHGHDVAGATLYVTLEPCSTPGRTGACTERIIDARLGRVCIGAIDPNPVHRGRAVALLREAGLEVSVGLLGERCEALNPEFNERMLAVAASAPAAQGGGR